MSPIRPFAHSRIPFIFLPLLFATCLFAYDGFSTSGYSYGAAAYLDRPVHAYSAALGKSVTAWTTDLAGTQFNPAIYDAATGVFLAPSYEFLSDDRRFIVGELAVPAGEYIVAGLMVRSFGVDDIEQRNEYGYLEGNFDDRENAFDISVAGRLPWNISAGIRARYLNQLYKGLVGIDDGQGHGMGFDLGAIWQPDPRVCVGVSGLNVGSYMWWATGWRDIVLPQARMGVAGMFFEKSLIAEADFVKTLRQPIDVSLGLQYTLFEIISARAGIASSVDIEERHSRDPDISLGAGIRYSFFGCDYSLVIPTDNAKDMLSHKISLVLRFTAGSLL